VGRSLLHASSVPLWLGLAEPKPRLRSTNSRLKPCRQSARMIDGAEAQRETAKAFRVLDVVPSEEEDESPFVGLLHVQPA
jgi:hypothetical protein